MIAATTATMASDHAAVGHDAVANDCTAATSALLLVAGHRAERSGHLLQEDDDRDAEGEPLDDRPRNVGHRATESQHARDHDDHARHHARAAPAPPTPCAATIGASTTTIAPVGPETCTFDPPNTAATTPAMIGRDESGLGARAGGDAERERERQRDDPDRDAREEIAAPGAAQVAVVGGAREEGRG